MEQKPASVKKILVIEDDRFIGEMYIRSLKSEGYAIDWMTDGDAGLDVARINLSHGHPEEHAETIARGKSAQGIERNLRALKNESRVLSRTGVTERCPRSRTGT